VLDSAVQEVLWPEHQILCQRHQRLALLGLLHEQESGHLFIRTSRYQAPYLMISQSGFRLINYMIFHVVVVQKNTCQVHF